MTNQGKLSQARKLLSEVNEDWNEEEVLTYTATKSFDEIVLDLYAIELKGGEARV